MSVLPRYDWGIRYVHTPRSPHSLTHPSHSSILSDLESWGVCWDGRSPRGVRGGSRTLVRGGCGLGACLYGFTHYAPLGLGSCSRARAAGRGWRGVRVQPRGSAAHARAASLYVSIKSEREHRQCSVRTQHVSQSSPLRPRQGTRAAGAAGDDTRHTHTRTHTARREYQQQ